MIDSFREENGATRFVPTSHNWTDLPCDRLADTRARYSGEVLGCGVRGTMIIFNGAIWHGHTQMSPPTRAGPFRATSFDRVRGQESTFAIACPRGLHPHEPLGALPIGT
jgi:ectoine hydroxylase-related dioxygenase (phytanoyl-CoA dioxygenase family)